MTAAISATRSAETERARARRAIGKERILTCRVLPSRGDRVPPAFLHFPLDRRPRRSPTSRPGWPPSPSCPIFFDETGHIRWAIWISQGQKIEKPWQYGKGLQIFAGALLFPWAREHYLWASRALAVLFGAGTLAGAILLGRALGGARVAGWPGSSTSRAPTRSSTTGWP